MVKLQLAYVFRGFVLFGLVMSITASRLYAEESMTQLGDLAGGAYSSMSHGVSSDGSVVVGQSISANGNEAFRWTAAGGMAGLGDLAGGAFYSVSNSVSSDASVVVGLSIGANGTEAFRWTAAGGMKTVAQLLTDAGVDLSNWTILSEARGVSADGNIVVGYGENVNGTEAFLANLAPSAGLLSVADFNASVNDLNVSQSISNHANRSLVQATAAQDLAPSEVLSAQPTSASMVTSYVNGSDVFFGGAALNRSYPLFNITGSFGVGKGSDSVRHGGETGFEGFWLGLGLVTTAGRLLNFPFVLPVSSVSGKMLLLLNHVTKG
jgi:probable HAF family extracellular repeat protein